MYILCLHYNKFNTNKILDKLNDEFSHRNIRFFIIPFFNKLKLALNENLQPNNQTITDNIISKYSNESLEKYGYKPRIRINTNFMSEANRVIYETEMIKAGIKIIGFCQNPNPIMKPLGYSWFGYGAGFTAFTHRNCPNTTPLAFWWGNPKESSSHPFSQWYPLMQRII